METRLTGHVAQHHFEQLEEFKKLDKARYSERILTPAGKAKQKKEEEAKQIREKVNMDEKEALKDEQPPVTKVEEKTQNPISQTQTISQPATKFQMPFEQLPVPEEFLTQFFQKFDLSQKFIIFQLEKYKVTNALPHPRELLSDLNGLDSGSKLKAQNELIAWFYDHALTEYNDKMKRMINMPYTGIRIGSEADQQRLLMNQGYDQQAIPSSIERQQWTIDRAYTGDGSQIKQRPPTYSDQSEVRELKIQLDQMRQERQNELQQKLRDYENKMEQQRLTMEQQRAAMEQQRQAMMNQQDPQLLELKRQIQDSQAATAAAVQRANDLQAQIMNNQLTDIKNQQLTADQVSQLIAQRLEQERSIKLSPEELERKIQDTVSKTKTGITQEAIDMKKVENEFEIQKTKLEVEKENKINWPETLGGVITAISEGIGRGMASVSNQPKPRAMPQYTQPKYTVPPEPEAQPMQEQTMPAQQPITQEPQQAAEPQIQACPVCNSPLTFSLPPGAVGLCSSCKTPLQINQQGELSVFNIPQQPPQPAPVTTTQPEAVATQSAVIPEPEQAIIPAEEPSVNTLGKCTGCGRPLYNHNLAMTDANGKRWCKHCVGGK